MNNNAYNNEMNFNTMSYFSKFDEKKIRGNVFNEGFFPNDNHNHIAKSQNQREYEEGNFVQNSEDFKNNKINYTDNNYIYTNEKTNYNQMRGFYGNGRGRKGYFNNNNNHQNNNYNYNNNHNSNGNSNSNNNNNNYYKGKFYKKKNFSYSLRWEGYDPLTIKSLIFRAETYIMSRYPNLGIVNTKNIGFSDTISENSKFFIIKSFNEEDVHKAIKYSLWSSTKVGNQNLNEAFKETQRNGGGVYLIFSCNGSGRYIGVARMSSEFNDSKEFNFWTQDSKWKGFFDVEWIFIKDIPFKCFKNVNILMK